MKLKRSLIILFLAFLCITCVSILIYFALKSGGVSQEKSALEDTMKRPRFSLEKFSMTQHYEGKRAFSLTADSFKIKRLKVGFFRIGIFREAAIKNLAISFYTYPLSQRNPGDASIPFEAMDFENVLKDGLVKKGFQNVTRFRIEKVRIDIFHDHKRLSTITSDEAHVSLRSKDIVFKGDVEIVTDDKKLKCPKMRYLKNQNVFQANKGFTLETNQGIRRGDWLEADYGLENIRM